MKKDTQTIKVTNGEIRLGVNSIEVYTRAEDWRMVLVEKYELKSKWVKVWPIEEAAQATDETAHKLRLAKAALRMYQRHNSEHTDLDSELFAVGKLGLGVYDDKAQHARWAVNYLDGWREEDKELFLSEIERMGDNNETQ